MKIHKADPAARRKSPLILGIAGIVLLVGGLLFGFDAPGRIDAHAEFVLSSPRIGVIAMAIGAVPLLVFAIYLCVFGARVIRAERLPLPGQAVVRDTPIREGQAAIYRGRLMQALAVLLALPVVLARVLGALTDG